MATRDLKNLIRPTLLMAEQVDDDEYSDYIDLGNEYESCVLLVTCEAVTASAGNQILPTLYEASATPGSTGSYSAVDSGDIEGAFAAIATTGSTAQYVGYKGGERYLCVFLNETGTFDGEVHVTAIVGNSGTKPPAAPTTGTVT
jgi:hypothetical protein